MSVKPPQTAWKNYTAKELSAQFELSAKELAECAEAGLILSPASRQKGPPYTEMDYLRLSVFKRCTQAGYGLNEVLDLIGRIHRRTAPIKTVILAKAFASDKLSDLESQMADGDALTQVNLRCDADILRSYIDDLAHMQSNMGEPSSRVAQSAVAAHAPLIPTEKPAEKRRSKVPSQTTRKPQAPAQANRKPQTTAPAKGRSKAPTQTKQRPIPKQSYPRTYGSLAEDSRQLWKRATPGGSMGWAVVLICTLVVVGGYLYFTRPEIVEHLTFSPDPAPETQLEVEEMRPEVADADKKAPRTTNTDPIAPAAASSTKKAATAKKPQTQKAASLTETASSDLEKIMAASGSTAAASSDSPRMIRINELVVFFDSETRILRVKIELLKNLVSNAPAAIRGRIFVTLKPVGDEDPQGIITVPRIPLTAKKMADFSKFGVAFSLEDQKTAYIKTQLSKQPPLQQQLAVYIFDNQQRLLHRETAIIKVKIV